MFRMRVRIAIGRLLNDDHISHALRAGGDQMETGIIKRCVDYDKDFKLRRLGLNRDQRAIAALYIFAKEINSEEYHRLEAAIRDYAKRTGVRPPFKQVDSHLSWPGGQTTWTH